MPFFFGALCSDSCLLVLLLGLFSGLSSEPVELWGEKTTFNGHPRANTQSSTRATERNGHPATPAPQPRSRQWSLLHQTRSTRAMQAPGHRQLPREASLPRALPRGGLHSRPAGAEGAPTLPQGHCLAGNNAPEKASSPALGGCPRLLQGDWPWPWQESMVTMQGCWSGDHTCPRSRAAWLRTGAQVVV